MPLPLDYATPLDAPQQSRTLPFLTSAALGALTFGAAWIAFWNVTFEPIVGVIAAVIAMIGAVGLIRVARHRCRRATAIAGAISGIIALVAIAIVTIF